MESLIATVSGAAVRRRRWFVAAWIVLLLVALPFSGKAQGVLSSGGFDVPGSQSEKVIDYLNSQPGGGAYASPPYPAPGAYGGRSEPHTSDAHEQRD